MLKPYKRTGCLPPINWCRISQPSSVQDAGDFSGEIWGAFGTNMLKADTRDDLAADSSPGCSSTVEPWPSGMGCSGLARHRCWKKLKACYLNASSWCSSDMRDITLLRDGVIEYKKDFKKYWRIWFMIHVIWSQPFPGLKHPTSHRRPTTPGLPHILSEALDPRGRHLSPIWGFPVRHGGTPSSWMVFVRGKSPSRNGWQGGSPAWQNGNHHISYHELRICWIVFLLWLPQRYLN